MMLYRILKKIISRKCREDRYDAHFHDGTEHPPVFTLLALRGVATGMVEYSFYRNERLVAVSRYTCPLPVESISIDIGHEKYQAKIDRFAAIPTVVNVMDLNHQRVIQVFLNGVGVKECTIDGHKIHGNKDSFTIDNQPLCLINRMSVKYLNKNGFYVDTKLRLEFFSDKYIGLTALLFMI